VSDFREGIPPQEGWYECEIVDVMDKFRVYWWNGHHWYIDRTTKNPIMNTRQILRFRGPLTLAQPSQEARERAIRIVNSSAVLTDTYTGLQKELQAKIEYAITTAEAAAYERGKEEGRREEESRWRAELHEDADFLQWIHDRLEQVHSEKYTVDYMRKLRDLIEKIQRADPPRLGKEFTEEERQKYKKILRSAIQKSTPPAKPAEPPKPMYADLTAFALLERRVKDLEGITKELHNRTLGQIKFGGA